MICSVFQNPLSTDLVINLSQDGIRLIFESKSQRLKVGYFNWTLTHAHTHILTHTHTHTHKHTCIHKYTYLHEQLEYSRESDLSACSVYNVFSINL